MEDLTWRYFGCGSKVGHYLFDPKEGQFYSNASSVDGRLGNMDGILPPHPEPAVIDYKASFSRLGGLGYSALSWWDRTVDKRTGSNSTVFVSSLTITPEDMLEQAALMFPWVFRRLPQPLTIMHTLTITEENPRAALKQIPFAGPTMIRLPEDVDINTGCYSCFAFTVAQSPSEGQVIGRAIVSGDVVTKEILEQHHAALKHMFVTGFNSYAVTKH